MSPTLNTSSAPAKIGAPTLEAARPALNRTNSSASRRSSRSVSPQTSPTALLHAPLPPAPIPKRLASSRLILDRTSPFHRRSLSVPEAEMMGLGLVIKVEGKVVSDGQVDEEVKGKREWAERVLWGSMKQGIKTKG